MPVSSDLVVSVLAIAPSLLQPCNPRVMYGHLAASPCHPGALLTSLPVLFTLPKFSFAGAEAQGAAASADTALSSGEAALEQSEDPEHYKLMKSLLYRSQQRGFLELDLLIGMWAQRNVPAMSISQLQVKFSEPFLLLGWFVCCASCLGFEMFMRLWTLRLSSGPA